MPFAVVLTGAAEPYRSKLTRLRQFETATGRACRPSLPSALKGSCGFTSPIVGRWLGPVHGDAALLVRVLAVAALLETWSANGPIERSGGTDTTSNTLGDPYRLL
jgi:hypothetical protein